MEMNGVSLSGGSEAVAPSAPTVVPASGVKIFSWNVAGLKSLTNVIQKHAPELNSVANSASSPSTPPLQKYLNLHLSPSTPTTVFSLQEVKIQLPSLKSTVGPDASIAFKFSSSWSIFFSPCRNPGELGFNGVATYVHTTSKTSPGSVIRADSSPFNDPELDKLGRCLLTDHSEFVLFNVYAPCTSGASGDIKERFNEALRRKMREVRSQGRKVILVGDLNISHKAIDTHPLHRSVDVNLLLSSDSKLENSKPTDKWVLDVRKLWKKVITQFIETGEVVPQTTTNSKTGQTHEKWRLRCKPLNSETGSVMLFSPEKVKENCEALFKSFSEQPMRATHVDMMIDLLKNIAGVEWDQPTLTELYDWKRSPDFFKSKHTKKFSKWIDSLVDEDGMIDTFRASFPNAEGRFTCFNQYTNRRYENEGARIDYILIDGSLSNNLREREGNEGLSCGNEKMLPVTVKDKGDKNAYADTIEAATSAATFSGAFVAAPFSGAGMGSTPPPAKAIADQFNKSQSGIIYTPPTFSDHLAVVAKLEFQERATELELESDKATKACQPHKAQKSLTGFFSSGANKQSAFSSSMTKKANTNAKAGEKRGFEASSNFVSNSKSKSKLTSSVFKSSTVPQQAKNKSVKKPKNDFFKKST